MSLFLALFKGASIIIEEIVSKNNTVYKDAKSLLQKKYRMKEKRFLAEGERLARDAYNAKTAEIIFLAPWAKHNDYEGMRMIKLPENLFLGLSDTENPQGVIAVCQMPPEPKLSGDFFVICDRISDPGNLGTILRTAEAAGVDGVLLSASCSDVYSPKVVRSSMGSIFRIPLYNWDSIHTLKQDGTQVVSLDLCGATSIYDVEKIILKNKIALMFGNEAHGISEESKKLCDFTIKLPMCGNVESLNVASCAAIVLYEIYRNRMTK